MRWAIAVAALTLLLALPAWTARAQLFPTGSDQAPAASEQTLLDTTIVMHPPDIDHLCMKVGAGTLTVRAQVVTGPADMQTPAPMFDLSGYQEDQGASITMQIGPNGSITSTPLTGAMYCWRLWVDPRALPSNAAQMSNAERGAFIQTIALRMTFTPQ